jgi:spore germination protein
MKNALLVLSTLLFIVAITAILFRYFSSEKKPVNFSLLTPFVDSYTLKPTDKPVEYNAWIPEWDERGAVDSLSSSKSKLKTISPVWYKLSEKITIEEISTPLKPEILSITTASGIKVVPMIGNDFDGKRIHTFLTNLDIQYKVIDTLIEKAKSKGYAGYDVDWEQIFPEDENLFVEFLRRFALKLHSEHKILSVAVHARTGDASDWDGSKGHNYKSIGRFVDQVKIMAYDYHSGDTEPGPVTPVDWMKKVIVYSRKNIEAEKVVLSLPLYGYDWGGGTTKGVTYTDVAAILKETGVSPLRDAASSEMTFKYTKDSKEHTVYYQDSQAIKNKIDIAKMSGIYQFCFWRLGGEDPAFWD